VCLQPLLWSDVNNWVMHGGSFLGTRKQTPERLLPQIALILEKHKIDGLFIIGGFEAFHSAQVYHDSLCRLQVFTLDTLRQS
jgi:6-phosphofructokinase 1